MSSEQPLLDDILFEENGRCGLMTLSREKALNALTMGMLTALDEKYRAWGEAPHIYGVVMKSSSAKAFCAGADIKMIAHVGRIDRTEAREFFRAEYKLNWALERFVKPHIALIDGILMGGGAGISRYGTHRVVSKNASFAMPETGIGLFPDVGASHFLSTMPGAMGLYLGLTGRRIGAKDMLALGFATHYIDAKHFASIEAAITSSDPIDPLVDDLAEKPGAGELADLRDVIDRCFFADSVDDILRRLEDVSGQHKNWAEATRQSLLTRSPTSLKVTFALLTAHKPSGLKQALETEFRVVSHILQRDDFYEGVRAQVIDKDRKPIWSPASLADVSDDAIEAMFAPLGGEELNLAGEDLRAAKLA